jgi:hypothetical protein
MPQSKFIIFVAMELMTCCAAELVEHVTGYSVSDLEVETSHSCCVFSY